MLTTVQDLTLLNINYNNLISKELEQDSSSDNCKREKTNRGKKKRVFDGDLMFYTFCESLSSQSCNPCSTWRKIMLQECAPLSNLQLITQVVCELNKNLVNIKPTINLAERKVTPCKRKLSQY